MWDDMPARTKSIVSHVLDAFPVIQHHSVLTEGCNHYVDKVECEEVLTQHQLDQTNLRTQRQQLWWRLDDGDLVDIEQNIAEVEKSVEMLDGDVARRSFQEDV